ncbi:MAG: hypothetical protein PHN31_00940 [Candidatus Gracilibacteria bacterium]|nr:hypothetical protein [Candidatus Gracilibacteria bacterium]
MITIKKLDNFTSLLDAIKIFDTTEFVGEFLKEINEKKDELFVVFKKEGKTTIFSVISDNNIPLPDLSQIFYSANLYQNEIYDYYGRTTKDFDNHILRLHTHLKDFFPLRKLGKPMIKSKKEFIFTTVNGEGLVEVPVGPIHAGIIPPGHFRFTVDGEDTLNLDTQMGWKHKGVEQYFSKEKDLDKLLEASQDIAGDSAIAYALGFTRLIEEASNTKLNKSSTLTRILVLELERIYNHIWTIGALGNDVGQSFLLNGYLSIREELLELNKEIFGSRTLKGVITYKGTNKKLKKEDLEKILKILKQVEKRVDTLSYIEEYSSGVYDRFKDTGIVNYDTITTHSGLGVIAKASKLISDYRIYDKDYIENNIIVEPILGIQGDSFDRFQVRAKEIFQSIEIIKKIIKSLNEMGQEKEIKTEDIKLKDGIYTSFVEGHRGEIFQMITIENGNITYYKAKDPSFVNWTLLEYAVLKNIIADFPICNKSFDLSYSGFDM